MIRLPSSQGICFCQELLLILADKKALLHFVCHHLTMSKLIYFIITAVCLILLVHGQ